MRWSTRRWRCCWPRHGPQRLAGRASQDGFFIFGEVSDDELADCAHEALARLQRGESSLAVSPLCGTNIAVAGLLAAGAATAVLSRNRTRFGNAFTAAMLGVFLSQPLRPAGTEARDDPTGPRRHRDRPHPPRDGQAEEGAHAGGRGVAEAHPPTLRICGAPPHTPLPGGIETWFSILSRQALRRSSFRSPREVRDRIDAFIAAYNRDARPLRWRAAKVHPVDLKRSPTFVTEH